jgi:hypothetical protein
LNIVLLSLVLDNFLCNPFLFTSLFRAVLRFFSCAFFLSLVSFGLGSAFCSLFLAYFGNWLIFSLFTILSLLSSSCFASFFVILSFSCFNNFFFQFSNLGFFFVTWGLFFILFNLRGGFFIECFCFLDLLGNKIFCSLFSFFSNALVF